MPTGVKSISSGGRGDDHYRGPICSGMQTVADSSSTCVCTPLSAISTFSLDKNVEPLPLILYACPHVRSFSGMMVTGQCTYGRKFGEELNLASFKLLGQIAKFSAIYTVLWYTVEHPHLRSRYIQHCIAIILLLAA